MRDHIRIVDLQRQQGVENCEIQNGEEFIIVCEGVDAAYFLRSFIESRIRKDQLPERKTLIVSSGGINDMCKGLMAIVKSRGFRNVQWLLVIQDAEKDASCEWDRTRNMLRKNALAVHKSQGVWTRTPRNECGPRTAIALFPWCNYESQAGTLEDLLMSALSEPSSPEILPLVDAFLEECKAVRGK